MKPRMSYRWVMVGLLWGVALLNYLDRQMLSTMRGVMKQDIKELESASHFGQLMAVFLWVYALTSPFAGFVADRISRKKIIAVSLLIWSLVTFLMGITESFTQLYLLRAIMGISEALYLPAALSLIATVHTGKTRSLAIGFHMSGLYAGQALGGFGALMAGQLTWKLTFFCLGASGIAYSLVLWLFLREDKGATRHPATDTFPLSGVKQQLRAVFLNPSFWVILFCFAVPSLPGWGVKNWVPTLFSQNLHLDMTVAGPLATITIAVSSFAGVLIGGKLSDSWVQRSSRARIYISATGLLFMIPALWLLGNANDIFLITLAAILFGLGFGSFDANNMPILCQFVPEGSRATAYGFMNLAGVMAGALVTSWLGKSTDAGRLGADFSLMAFVVAAVVLLQLTTLFPKKENN